MTLGEKIKKLRQQNNITQETLAEYLNISFQSISKWENNYAMPDVSMLIPLANYFGITIDELFDRDSSQEKKEIAEWIAEERRQSNIGHIEGVIEMWTYAVEKYPRNYECIFHLAQNLWSTLHRSAYSEESKKENAKKTILLLERIVRDCQDRDLSDAALQLLVYTYSDTRFEFANEELAIKYANMAGDFYFTKQMLLPIAYFTKERREEGKGIEASNILSYVDQIQLHLLNAGKTVDEKIFAAEKMLEIWNALIYDGNFLFYHCRISSIYNFLARQYAEKKNEERTLEYIEKALYHAEKYDKHTEKENFTSIFLNNAVSEPKSSMKNYTESEVELCIKSLDDLRYDFLRGNDRFKKLIGKKNESQLQS